ncbi:hypothetical protein [Branchiibius cervicis]|uniref:Uncharacterized protein n=1 Tax=Branchiibius cervicis TaxID=908252 RepID=A0ABW2ANJ3_9MICO
MYTTKHSACSTTHRLALVAAVPLSAALLLSGAGAASAARLPEGSSGTTSISWTIVNTTGVNLTLATASNPYGHWQKRPVNLASGQSETISDYSDNIAGAELKVTYTEPTGQRITMTLTDPIAGDDTLTGSSNDSTIGFDNSLNHGYHVSGTTEINQGRVTLDTPGGPSSTSYPPGSPNCRSRCPAGQAAGPTARTRATSRMATAVTARN